jgi:hypothetical protein
MKLLKIQALIVTMKVLAYNVPATTNLKTNILSYCLSEAAES